MKERPILFSAPMVGPVLDGTKTQTRRVVKPQPQTVTDQGIKAWDGDAAELLGLLEKSGKVCPYGQPGDRLWVREAFRFTDVFDGDSPARVGERCVDAGYRSPWAPLQFEADGQRTNWQHTGTPPDEGPPKPGKLRPGMFMPRWASRITLEVTAVRVERLQSISETDAIAEGIEPAAEGYWRLYGRDTNGDMDRSARTSYRSLWESINGPGSWDANPWVWVIEFKRLENRP